jgi:hypothetical protein
LFALEKVMKQPVSTLKLLLMLTYVVMYLAFSLAVLRVIAPALISSQDDSFVLFGFVLIATWLVWSIALAYHLFTKRRVPAATTKEEHQ